jgi:hypothetical protein
MFIETIGRVFLVVFFHYSVPPDFGYNGSYGAGKNLLIGLRY